MKDLFLTDREIQDLIDEPKRLQKSPRSVFQGIKQKKGREASFLQNSVEFPRTSGEGTWLIYLRYNKENMFDFSCGLGFIPEGRQQPFMLRRYNGKSHYHSNRLEEDHPFIDFHIHKATERYQRLSYNDDHYAEPTNRYADLYEAFKCLLNDCNVVNTDPGSSTQQEIFQ